MNFGIVVTFVCSLLCVQEPRSQKTHIAEHYVEQGSLSDAKRLDSSECGIYSLAAAAKTFRPDLDVFSVLNKRYVQGGAGSSASDLIQASLDHGFEAIPWKSVGIPLLKSVDCPVLLNITRNRSSPCNGHWVAWLGEKDGVAIIYDVLLPDRITTIPYSELLDGMTGDALLIRPKPLGFFASWLIKFGSYKPFAPLIPLFLIAFFQFGWRSDKCKPIRLRWQILALLSYSITWGVSANLARDGIFRSPAVTSWIAARKVVDSSFPDTSIEQFLVFRRRKDVVVIDARPIEAFNEAHISNSLNLPIDGAAGAYKQALIAIPKETTLIVYCASDQCGWDGIVANRLDPFGYNKVRIFESGFEGYLNWIARNNENLKGRDE